MEWWHIPALLAGGFLCGIINAAAGGGSFITLPILLLYGLPPQIANATNRVAITVQTFAGVATYHVHGVRPWRALPPIALVTALGAFGGAWLAATVDETLFRRAAAILFAVMLTTVFINPRKWAGTGANARIRPALYPIFFLMGIYGGFLQAGVGVLLISTFVLLGGYDVVRGNALKFSLAFVFTGVSLVAFAGFGQVRWGVGLILAIGTALGGIIGARLVMLKGATWVRALVVVAAVAAIVKLLTG
ncbi:MAG: sulfite exporter TauE/SafE family protein [Candidatus Eisenbacteria bacterium]|nr:sulfite exporter TauE/SafE family protein [Candidatus Eisenbacteria bacterium]